MFTVKLMNGGLFHIVYPSKIQTIHSIVRICWFMRHTHLTRTQIVFKTARRTIILTRKGLFSRMDKYEPHNFYQFSNEQIVCPRLIFHNTTP